MEENTEVPDISDTLVPEVCMDTDDAPIEMNENEDATEENTENPPEEHNGEAVEGDVLEVEDDAQDTSGEVNNNPVEINEDPLDANQENVNPSQIPEPYTAEEAVVYQQMFGPGQQAVQFLRLHCTACNKHLGSAPNKQNKRYIHPLLKVLFCKDCFNWYGSGDFDKDEDGSELYCRWCGQGGKVLCCANMECPYVFCQKCIRTNLGKKALDKVIESDDWTCFICKPEPLIKLRVTCRALHDFIQEQVGLAAELNQPDRLRTDHSLCCRPKPKPITPKPIVTKRKDSEDVAYDPFLNNDDVVPKKKKLKFSILNHMINTTNRNSQPYSMPPTSKVWESQEEEDEVVCTPDLSLLMDEEESSAISPDVSPQRPGSPQLSSASCSTLPYTPMLQGPPSVRPLSPYQNNTAAKDTEVQYVGQTRIINFKNSTPQNRIYSAKTKARGYTLPSKPPVVLNTSTNRPINTKNIVPNIIQLQTPSTKLAGAINKPVVTVSHNRNNSVIDTTSARLAPGLRYEWFEKATQFTAKVNQNLSTRLCSLSKEQSNVTSLEGLAGIHNSLQEILSNSINSLMQIRKNLRTEFIAGLKKLKFCKAVDSVPRPQIAAEDNDVILVDANTTSTARTATSDEDRPHGYIKVKPPSELLDSSIVTITDNNSSKPPNDGLTMPDELLENAHNNKGFSAEKDPSQASNYINTNEALSEIPEILNPETVSLIKKALVESKFETIVNDNLKWNVEGIPKSDLKKMLSVRVVIATNFGSATPRTRPRKNYKPMNIIPADEQDIEQMLSTSVLLNTSKRKAFDDSFSAFVATRIQPSQGEESHVISDSDDEVTVIQTDSSDKLLNLAEEIGISKTSVNEESAQDVQTTDSGIDVDGEQSLSNGIPLDS